MAKGTLYVKVDLGFPEIPLQVVNDEGDVIDQVHMDGNTYQVYISPDKKEMTLYPVSIAVDDRCTVVIGGERCGCKAGHEGKHWWGRGD